MERVRTRARRLGAALAGLGLLIPLLGPSAAVAQDGDLFGEESVLRELYRLVREDYRTAAILRRLEADSSYFETNPAPKTSVPDGDRRRAVALARNELTNRLLVEGALEDLRARSRTILEGLERARATNATVPESQVWDSIVVGAGIHDQVLNNTLAKDSADLRVLTIERSNVVASNFANAGDGGRVNSTTRPTNEDVTPKPGTGNLNEFPGGALQVPDASTTKNPAFRVLSDVATVNRAASKNPVLFGKSVSSVEDARSTTGADPRTPWPARYRVTLESGETLYTNSVVYGTGLGSPALPKVEPASIKTLETALAEGKAFTYESFMRRNATERNPYREFAGKSVIVVGTGDSAKVAIEWLLRLAPDRGYGEDTTQTGMVEKIFWIGQTAEDCKKFIESVRVRYADIAGGIKSGIVVPVPGRLSLAARAGDGKILDVTENNKVSQADYVILATGYESRLEATLSKIVSNDRDGTPLGPDRPITGTNLVRDLRANLPGRNANATVARQLAGHEIYFMGAAAGTIVPVEEVANVPENLKSIYGLGPRTAAFAKILADSLAARKVNVPAGARVRTSLTPADAGVTKVALVGKTAPEPRDANPLVDLALESQLRGLLRRSFALAPGADGLDLTFGRNEAGTVELRFGSTITAASAVALKDAIEANPTLLRNLETVIGPADAPNNIALRVGREGERAGASTRLRVAPSASLGMAPALDGGVKPAVSTANVSPVAAPPTIYSSEVAPDGTPDPIKLYSREAEVLAAARNAAGNAPLGADAAVADPVAVARDRMKAALAPLDEATRALVREALPRTYANRRYDADFNKVVAIDIRLPKELAGLDEGVKEALREAAVDFLFATRNGVTPDVFGPVDPAPAVDPLVEKIGKALERLTDDEKLVVREYYTSSPEAKLSNPALAAEFARRIAVLSQRDPELARALTEVSETLRVRSPNERFGDLVGKAVDRVRGRR
ncbi:MAG: hypothetical protein ACAI25_19370 [Planctomycetota bacterium]